MTSKTTTIEHWLLEAADLTPGDTLNIYLWDYKGPPPSYPDMRAALYAQYGENTPIRIWKHGERICVFIHKAPEDRARFDRRSAPSVYKNGGKRIEVENGFTKELPPA